MSLIPATLKGEKIPISSYPRLFGTSNKTTRDFNEKVRGLCLEGQIKVQIDHVIDQQIHRTQYV